MLKPAVEVYCGSHKYTEGSSIRWISRIGDSMQCSRANRNVVIPRIYNQWLLFMNL